MAQTNPLQISLALSVLVLGLSLPAWADSPLQTGQPAPAFRFRNTTGKMFRLDSLAYPGPEKSWSKKRPVFLEFFRTDCRVCLKKLPEVIALHQSHAKAGLQVLRVAILEEENGRARLDAYLKDHPIPFPVLMDPTGHYAQKYLGSSSTLPTYVLIDKNGTVNKLQQGGGNQPLSEVFEASIQEVLK